MLKKEQEYCRIPCLLECARGRKLEGLWEVLGLWPPLPAHEMDPLGEGEPSFRKCAWNQALKEKRRWDDLCLGGLPASFCLLAPPNTHPAVFLHSSLSFLFHVESSFVVLTFSCTGVAAPDQSLLLWDYIITEATWISVFMLTVVQINFLKQN